jgi:hypothetical protein
MERAGQRKPMEPLLENLEKRDIRSPGLILNELEDYLNGSGLEDESHEHLHVRSQKD